MGRKKVGSSTENVQQDNSTPQEEITTAATGRRRFIAPMQKTKTLSKEQKQASRSAIFESLLEVNRQKFGADKVLSTADEMDQLIVGVPAPSLAFEYLIMNDVFPLKTLLMIAGTWGSCKTSLAIEFFRWIRMADGFCAFINTEQKFDSDLAYGILRETPQDQPFFYLSADSVESYQTMLTYSLKAYKKIPNAEYIPGIFVIDSLASATSESSHEKIEKDGHASRNFALHASLNKDYISKLKNDYAQWPISIVYINHLKQGPPDHMGRSKKYTLGGQAVNYHESFEIHSEIKKKNITCTAYTGTQLELTCAKNSYGRTGNKIPARFLHTMVDVGNGQVQEVHYWDWNWSIVMLLYNLIKVANSPYASFNRSRLLERNIKIDMDSTSMESTSAKAWFPLIGINKSDALPISELGRLIHENEQVCDLIREALNIKRRITFSGSMTDHIEEFKEHVE